MAETTVASGLTNSPFIGIKNLHVAKLLTDPASGTATYGDIIAIPQLRGVNIKPTNADATLYADNQAIDTDSATSEYEMTFDMANLPLEYRGMLCGHTVAAGVMAASKDDAKPYFAVMFESTKKNGKVRFMKFYKVLFKEPSENPKTKEQNLSYNTPTFDAKAIYRTSDGKAYTQADEEATDYAATTGSSWYTAV